MTLVKRAQSKMSLSRITLSKIDTQKNVVE